MSERPVAEPKPELLNELQTRHNVLSPDELAEFEADMDQFAEFSEQIPVLPPEAFSRENIYSPED